jgi:hypothetical protein
MKSGKFENSLALVGVLIVLFAVSTAANKALADDADLLKGNLKTEVTTSSYRFWWLGAGVSPPEIPDRPVTMMPAGLLADYGPGGPAAFPPAV